MSDQYISIKASTWHRESHGLYDYESSNISKRKLKITSESIIVQTSDKVLSIQKSAHYEQSSDTKFLLSLSKSDSNYIIEPNKSIFQEKGFNYETPWLVLKNLKGTSGYILSEGDVIRLGKVELKIKEIKGSRKNKTQKNIIKSRDIFLGGIGGHTKILNNSQLPLDIKVLHEDNDEAFQCRICLNDDNSIENPLIAPCKCTGSMGLIHLECLQRWLSSKVATRETNNSLSYSWKSLECELCKFKYPDRIQIKEKIVDLLFIKKPENNFIVLESVGPALGGQSNMSKTVNVISFQDRNIIRLGRGHDSDIRLPDISVSRDHANIKFTNAGLFLDDISSKFGTLVKIKKPILLTPNSKFSIQCGRSLLEINIKKPFNFFACLGVCNKHKNSEDISRPIRDVTEENISQNLDHSS
ncbi:hypothetical protein SteCoe_37992 [Stentor coeruleus]|uniref:RING-CH-type domain-containing protein n=1 Tax=Stentor coeruleus TaxID=5963 RepID=A0A1R2AM31_9CILI|nr:hypothetical protein SteCoe_37992 [Stentor coeruleus]